MDFFQNLFLESPIRLGVLTLIVLAAALYARRRYMETFGKHILPAAAVLLAALFAIQYLVVTDREEIEKALEEFVAAIEANDSARIDAAISDDYSSEAMVKQDIVAFIERTLSRLKIYDTRFHRRDVTVQDEPAEMIVAARATVSVEGGVGEMHWGSWRIDWLREGGTWRIVAIRPIMLDTQEISGMKGLRGVIP
ncbi:MAG TPA: nuclear transport factor 2 family protein [Phycisphaerae bacterium]|nr:nuclear transport factor 2 family protein [Phycisphaerae bacterium]